jgi:hypothetical protein
MQGVIYRLRVGVCIASLGAVHLVRKPSQLIRFTPHFGVRLPLALFRPQEATAFDPAVSTFVDTMIQLMVCWPRGGPS